MKWKTSPLVAHAARIAKPTLCVVAIDVGVVAANEVVSDGFKKGIQFDAKEKKAGPQKFLSKRSRREQHFSERTKVIIDIPIEHTGSEKNTMASPKLAFGQKLNVVFFISWQKNNFDDSRIDGQTGLTGTAVADANRKSITTDVLKAAQCE